jgi:glycerol kinase
VAHLAGLTAGLWDWKKLQSLERGGERFAPRLPAEARRRERLAWSRAVRRARGLGVE